MKNKGLQARPYARAARAHSLWYFDHHGSQMLIASLTLTHHGRSCYIKNKSASLQPFSPSLSAHDVPLVY